MDVYRRKKQSGFTLIEVLVALVVVGVALPALLVRMQGVLDHTSYINTKTYAYWFAENKMQELFLTQKLQKNVVKTKKKQDEEEFAGLSWHWRTEIEETAVENMYRVEIFVGLEQDETLANLSGFLLE